MLIDVNVDLQTKRRKCTKNKNTKSIFSYIIKLFNFYLIFENIFEYGRTFLTITQYRVCDGKHILNWILEEVYIICTKSLFSN